MDDGILKVLAERGPMYASDLAREASRCTGHAYRAVKSRVWQMVDERRLRWLLDRRIALLSEEGASE